MCSQNHRPSIGKAARRTLCGSANQNAWGRPSAPQPFKPQPDWTGSPGLPNAIPLGRVGPPKAKACLTPQRCRRSPHPRGRRRSGNFSKGVSCSAQAPSRASLYSLRVRHFSRFKPPPTAPPPSPPHQPVRNASLFFRLDKPVRNVPPFLDLRDIRARPPTVCRGGRAAKLGRRHRSRIADRVSATDHCRSRICDSPVLRVRPPVRDERYGTREAI